MIGWGKAGENIRHQYREKANKLLSEVRAEIEKCGLTDEEIDALTPSDEEIEAYLAEPDDKIAASLDPATKRLVARVILLTRKVAQAMKEKILEALK